MQFKHLFIILFALVCVQQVLAGKDCRNESKDKDTCNKCCEESKAKGTLINMEHDGSVECHCSGNRGQVHQPILHIWDYLAPF